MISIQNPYSLLNRTFEVGLAEMAIRERVSLLAYSPMAFGLLSGKYHRGNAPDSARLNRYDYLSRYNGKNSFEATRRYLEIAEEAGLSLAQMALGFVNSRPFWGSNIIGATNLTQLKENIDSLKVSLEPDIQKAIEVVHQSIPNPAP